MTSDHYRVSERGVKGGLEKGEREGAVGAQKTVNRTRGKRATGEAAERRLRRFLSLRGTRKGTKNRKAHKALPEWETADSADLLQIKGVLPHAERTIGSLEV